MAEFRYDPLTGKLYWASPRPKVNVGDEAGWIEPYRNTFYRRVTVNYRRLYVHRVVWEMHNGPIPAGMMVDHINGDGLDNRLENLRLVTTQGNNRNARKPRHNSSGASGVTWSKNAKMWRAFVRENGKQAHIGYFASKDNAIEAVRCRREAAGYHENHGR
jgi:hypothetical protein